MLFKRILIAIAVVVGLAIMHPIVTYVIKRAKNYDIDQTVRQEIVELYTKYGSHGQGIISLDLYNPPPITWNDKLLRFNSKSQIETSTDGGKSWVVSPKFDEAPCFYVIPKDGYLVCISGDRVAFLDTEGNLIKQRQFTKTTSAQHDLAIYQLGNEVTMVWSDDRARWNNLFSYIPIPNSVDPESGPFLLMAGKLNLDTLDFKEYVIGYNASRLEDIGISPK